MFWFSFVVLTFEWLNREDGNIILRLFFCFPMRVENENVKTSFGQLRKAARVVQNDSRLYNSYPSNYFDLGETLNS